MMSMPSESNSKPKSDASSVAASSTSPTSRASLADIKARVSKRTRDLLDEARDQALAMRMPSRPHAVLCDFGGTLLEEAAYDLEAGNGWLLSRATVLPSHVSLDAVVARARQIGQQVMARRD